MQCEIRGMADANPRVSDTLPRRGRVNEVCREWVVHEDEALAYQLQKKEVEQHYDGNKERNARVREDFPKAKEEQEKEILEAAEKYRQMVRQQEQIDSTYARRIAERMDREEYERRKRAELHDQVVARRMQAYEVTRNANQAGLEPQPPHHRDRLPAVKALPVAVPDVNRVGLPLVQNANFESVGKHQPNLLITHTLRNLRVKDDSGGNRVSPPPPPLLPLPSPEMEALPSCSANSYASSSSQSPSPLSLTSSFQQRASQTRTPTPATLLPEDVNEIITDADLREEANKRMQEEKDAELARMLQQQEEEILNEEVDRDRMMAIEAQDKELAKLLYEKEKAKLRRAKERARQRALLKKQQQQDGEAQSSTMEQTTDDSASHSSRSQSDAYSLAPYGEGSTSKSTTHYGAERRLYGEEEPTHSRTDVEDEQRSLQPWTSTGGRTTGPPIVNVAMHIDPTYLSQQSSSMPNSLIFQEGDTTAPPYMPIQGQRRNSPFIDKKPKKSKAKDGCKQQ